VLRVGRSNGEGIAKKTRRHNVTTHVMSDRQDQILREAMCMWLRSWMPTRLDQRDREAARGLARKLELQECRDCDGDGWTCSQLGGECDDTESSKIGEPCKHADRCLACGGAGWLPKRK
jgi:hypothetical protein